MTPAELRERVAKVLTAVGLPTKELRIGGVPFPDGTRSVIVSDDTYYRTAVGANESEACGLAWASLVARLRADVVKAKAALAAAEECER